MQIINICSFSDKLVCGYLAGWCDIRPLCTGPKQSFFGHHFPAKKCHGPRNNGKRWPPIFPFPSWCRNGPCHNSPYWQEGSSHGYRGHDPSFHYWCLLLLHLACKTCTPRARGHFYPLPRRRPVQHGIPGACPHPSRAQAPQLRTRPGRHVSGPHK